MVFIPFIFFTALTIYWWHKHNGLDVCVYMSGLFALTSFFSILIVLFSSNQGTGGNDSGGMLWGGWEPELGLIPTLSYCLLIGACIFPFSFIHIREIKNITNNAPWSFWLFGGLLIATALVNLYCVADSTVEILSGDLQSVRESAYAGDQTPAELKAATLPFPLGHLTYFNFCTTLSLPMLFYNLCYKHKPWWWNVLLLFSSITPILAGIQRADRTEPIYFTLMFVFCIIFFHTAFSKKVKILVGGIIAVFALLGTTYLVAVTVARFEDRSENGSLVSAIQYGGQNYLNYCYFCEYSNSDNIHTAREFPIINHTLFKIDSNEITRGEMSAEQGFFISVFASFIGDILLDVGPIGLLIWVAFYVLLVFEVVKYKHRETYDISEILILFMLSSIPIFGIFYYRYFAWMIGLNYVLLILFRIVSKYKLVYVNSNGDSDIQSDKMD